MHPFLALKASKQLSCKIMTSGSFSISLVSFFNFKGTSSQLSMALSVYVCVCVCVHVCSVISSV